MKKIFLKNVKNVPPHFFFFFIFFLIFCILFELNCKNVKNAKMAFFVIFSRFFENVQRIHLVFCCKGRQSPWQKPANLYSTKCRIFMRQNLCRGSQCTTRARPSGERNIFFFRKIFSSPEKFVLTKFKKFLKNFFFFEKYFLKKFL